MHETPVSAGKTRRPLHKRYITLIEILIAIAILSIAAGITAIGIRQVMREQRFRTEAAEIVTTLRLAQQIMLILNTDVHVKFKSQEGKGFTYRIELDDKLTERWHKELTKPRPPLQEIHAINFIDALGGSPKKDELDVRFLSGGSVMSQGIMRLGVAPPGTPNTQETFICFPGFPHFFQTTAEAGDDPACNIQKQRRFDQIMTQFTVTEVTEKNRIYKDVDNEEGEGSKEKPKNAASAPKKKES